MRPFLPIAALLVLSACGGESASTPISPSTPLTPSTPVASNRAPIFASVSVSPAFGISQVTTFTMSATASDPDGDPLTYRWDFGDGQTATGQFFTKTYSGTGVAVVGVTATDSRNGSASETRTITVGSMSGHWVGSIPGFTNLTLDFQQTGTVVTGTFTDGAGNAARTDPAQQGRIDGSGNVELRWKIAVFNDPTFRGQMDQSGRRITGGVFGSGFNGQPFEMTKQ